MDADLPLRFLFPLGRQAPEACAPANNEHGAPQIRLISLDVSVPFRDFHESSLADAAADASAAFSGSHEYSAMGLHPWPCGIVLAHFIGRNPHLFARASVLELGCGTALPSLMCAHAGASVVIAADAHAHVIANTRRLFARHGHSPSDLDPAAPAATPTAAAAAVPQCSVFVERLPYTALLRRTPVALAAFSLLAGSSNSSSSGDRGEQTPRWVLGADLVYSPDTAADAIAAVAAVGWPALMTAEDRGADAIFALVQACAAWRLTPLLLWPRPRTRAGTGTGTGTDTATEAYTGARAISRRPKCFAADATPAEAAAAARLQRRWGVDLRCPPARRGSDGCWCHAEAGPDADSFVGADAGASADACADVSAGVDAALAGVDCDLWGWRSALAVLSSGSSSSGKGGGSGRGSALSSDLSDSSSNAISDHDADSSRDRTDSDVDSDSDTCADSGSDSDKSSGIDSDNGTDSESGGGPYGSSLVQLLLLVPA